MWVVMGSMNICSLVPEWGACRLLSPDSDGLVHVLNQNWKNKSTPNCRHVLKSLLDEVNSELFGFHQRKRLCPNRVAFVLE